MHPDKRVRCETNRSSVGIYVTGRTRGPDGDLWLTRLELCSTDIGRSMQAYDITTHTLRLLHAALTEFFDLEPPGT